MNDINVMNDMNNMNEMNDMNDLNVIDDMNDMNDMNDMYAQLPCAIKHYIIITKLQKSSFTVTEICSNSVKNFVKKFKITLSKNYQKNLKGNQHPVLLSVKKNMQKSIIKRSKCQNPCLHSAVGSNG